jgi:hypothetical protein
VRLDLCPSSCPTRSDALLENPQPSVSARNAHHGNECVPMNHATTKNCAKQQHDRDVHQHAVVVVARHRRHHFLRRVVRVLAEDRIGQRHEQEGVGEREDTRERIAAAQEVQRDSRRWVPAGR